MKKNENFEDLPLSDPAFDALFHTPQVHSADELDADDDAEPTEEDSEDQA